MTPEPSTRHFGDQYQALEGGPGKLSRPGRRRAHAWGILAKVQGLKDDPQPTKSAAQRGGHCLAPHVLAAPRASAFSHSISIDSQVSILVGLGLESPCLSAQHTGLKSSSLAHPGAMSPTSLSSDCGQTETSGTEFMGTLHLPSWFWDTRLLLSGKPFPGASLVIQWLRLHTSTGGGAGSIPGQGTKILHATQCG